MQKLNKDIKTCLSPGPSALPWFICSGGALQISDPNEGCQVKILTFSFWHERSALQSVGGWAVDWQQR